MQASWRRDLLKTMASMAGARQARRVMASENEMSPAKYQCVTRRESFAKKRREELAES